MKINFIALLVPLAVVWFLWSGHTESFVLTLGAVSCLAVVGVCQRLSILDEETVPWRLGWRPFIYYAPWLVKEIVVANLDVAGRILTKRRPLCPRVIELEAQPNTELGQVILANSITLTPGTVSVDLRGSVIRVHALSLLDAEQDLAGDMNRRVRALEE